MGDRWSWMDTGEHSGAFNMSLDEELARRLAAGQGTPAVRVFRWKPWAISLGYNQRADELERERCSSAGIDIVRRPTGGRAILHAEELTYSVVMIAGRRSVLDVYNDISRALVRGLALYGVEVALQKSQADFPREYRSTSSIPCFSSSARYEIEYRGRKLVGSAQRRLSDGTRDVVLQHGSILCGPAHQRLADYLAAPDAEMLERIRVTLRERTADLGSITGAAVDYQRLAACIRRGFEECWDIGWTEGVPEAILTHTG